MNAAACGAPCEPFFLPAAQGQRFCLFHPAAGAPRGSIVYVHPFVEEMNKSRRMASLQSRALAARGYAVLQIDLFGCGDSSGDFADASWEIWRQDVKLGAEWIAQHAGGGVTLWGLRLGAMLALDAAQLCERAPQRFVLWQPVLNGEALLTQFLRLRVASEMLSATGSASGVQELRATLAAGTPVEVAGYLLSPALAASIDSLRLAALKPGPATVHWLEVVPQAGRALPPAAQRVADAWLQSGVRLNAQCVAGPPFWNTLEITDCPALISATDSIFAQGPQ